MASVKLGQKAVGSIIKLNENGSMVDFIVLHQGNPDSSQYVGFENGTVVRRKDIHSIRRFGGYSSSYSYADSEIDLWLNNETSGYLSLLDADIRGAIKTVKIPYQHQNTIQQGSNGLDAEIFLLSVAELGFTYSSLEVGAKLEYFESGTSYSATQKRLATFNGELNDWATRSLYEDSSSKIYAAINESGSFESKAFTTYSGILPTFVLDSNLSVSDDGTVSVNQPPTAPGSITVTNVTKGQQATITLTAATDSDGTVVNYIYERRVDGGTWSQFASANSLTQTDTIGSDWGTVAYRAKAVDDDGAEGPYATSTTETVNSGMLIIDGPDDVLGDKPIPFSLEFELGTSDQTSVTGIDVSVTLDGESLYTGARDTGVSNILYLDTRLLSAGTHTLQVDASKEDYLPASATYTFNVPAITLPDGGKAEQPENSNGDPVWWYGLARYIIGEGGKDLNAITKELREAVKSAPKFAYGSYMGTGTYGASNPTTITCGFKPSLAFIFDDIGSVSQSAWESLLVWCGQSQDAYYGLHFESDGTSLSWYSTINANCQWNISGNTAYYAIIGFDE